ncbi:MAG: hypothetical protein CMI60_03095 [Parvibaculum sp.]|nr:hypothetical protein [Parvibaculum sp.]
MSDKENFAKWLTDNAHLKGTPEWDSVAKAFTEVDMVPTSTLPNNQVVEGPSDLGTAAIDSIDKFQDMIGRSGVTLGQSLKTLGPRWQALQEGTQDLLTKYTGLKPAEEPGVITQYLQQAGNKFTPYGEEYGQQLSDYGDRQSEYNKKQIADRGYVSPYQENLRTTYNEGTLLDTVGWLTWRTSENAASLASSVGGALATVLSAPISLPLSWMIGGTTIGVNTLATMGEVGQESDEKIGRENANHTSELFFGLLNGMLDRFGARGVIPKNKLMKMTYAEVVEELTKKKKFAAVKAINRALLREGITEGIQDGNAMLNAYINGGVYEKQEVIDRLIDSAAVGAAGGAAVSTTTESGKKVVGAAKWVGNGFTRPADMTEEDLRAAGAFAGRLGKLITEDPKWRVKNIKPGADFGAVKLVAKAHSTISEQMKILWKELKSELKIPSGSNQAEQEARVDAILSHIAYRDAKTKTKGSVTQAELTALEKLVGHTTKGQQLINLMRETNQLTALHNSGYKGGISSFTDVFLPFSNQPSYAASNTLNKAAGVALGVGTFSLAGGGAPGALAVGGQLAIGGGGRVLDMLSGRRSRVAKYIKDNKQLPGFKPLTGGLTLAEQKELGKKEADKKTTAVRKQGYENGVQPYWEGERPSPRGAMWMAAGYVDDATKKRVDNRDTRELDEEIITLINDAVLMNPELREAADSYIKNIPLGKNVEGDFLDLLTTVRAVVQTNSQSEPKVQTEIGGGFQAGGVTTNTSPGYNRGIQDNKRFVGDLLERANKDTSLSLQDKGQILTALDTMSRNLGFDPMTTSQQIHDKLLANDVNTQAVGMYIKPYVDRIANQQNTAPQLQQPVNETMEAPNIDTETFESRLPEVPALEQSITNEDILPTNEEVIAMRDGTFVPEDKRKLVDAANLLNDRWKLITGRDEPFEYNDQNVEVISDAMAREAVNNLSKDGNAIGWYDRKIKAAKQVISLVEPRITQSPDAEAAFDFALAVTSNGQAVEMNFEYAVDVFRQFMDTGKMPTNFKQGGERNAAMRTAFEFFNAYNGSSVNEPIQMFLDRDFTVATLNDTINEFNKKHGTNIKVPSSETVNTPVKGSYILGPKIGQGFYQNIRGNYEPLTMDIWWMRMWNRMVGRPFVTTKSPEFMSNSRKGLADQIKKSTGLERKLINETLKSTNETRKGLYKDKARFEAFIEALEKRYQKFYRQYKKDNGVNHNKPQLFQSTGTYTKNMVKQLQAQPTPADRPYMRRVTARALEKLREQGIDITTADFQALMWYPEKLLYRKLGVQPGNGSDNDYLDAARLLAQKEGISNDQIQEALPQSERDGEVDSRTGTATPNDGVYRDAGRGNQEEGGILRSQSPADLFPGAVPLVTPGTVPGAALTTPSTNLEVAEVKPFLQPAKEVFEIGKKGSEFENGVDTMEKALRLAKALNLSVEIVDKLPDATLGQIEVRPYTATGKIKVLKKGSDHPAFEGEIISEIQELVTLSHEIAHGLAVPRVDRRPSPESEQGPRNNPLVNQKSKAANLSVRRGSFNDFILDATGLKNEEQIAIIKEIINLQENVDLIFENRPELGSEGIRPFRAMEAQGKKRAAKETKEHLADDYYLETLKDPKEKADYIAEYTNLIEKGYQSQVKTANQNFRMTYTRNVNELAVDPLMLYISNPKMAKELAPTVSKKIRYLFNNFGGPKNPVTFYTFPLATILAIVMASLAAKDAEDEERNRLMQAPPGALTPPPAALSGMMI